MGVWISNGISIENKLHVDCQPGCWPVSKQEVLDFDNAPGVLIENGPWQWFPHQPSVTKHFIQYVHHNHGK